MHSPSIRPGLTLVLIDLQNLHFWVPRQRNRKKWRARLLSIWSVTSGDRFSLSIDLRSEVTHYSSSHHHNNQTAQMKEQQ